MLVLIPVCLIGGLVAGPGIAAMYDLILARLRDNEDDWFYRWKKSMGQNLRASLLPGVVMCLFIGFLVFAFALIWWATVPPTPGTIAILAASAMLCLMVFSVWWPQVVLFDQKPGIQLKNCILFCILFCIRYFWRIVGVAAQQLVWWAFMVLILPWSAFALPFLGSGTSGLSVASSCTISWMRPSASRNRLPGCSPNRHRRCANDRTCGQKSYYSYESLLP